MRRYLAMVTIAVSLLFTSSAFALERKSIADIDTDQLTDDTQVSAPTNSDHMNLVWWIPYEFWHATFLKDKNMAAANRNQILKSLKPYSIIAICQADISYAGAFQFYSKEEIKNHLDLMIRKDDGREYKISPISNINADLKVLLDIFTPILSAAMGNMGKNFHFYVLKDISSAGIREIDPYSTSILKVGLSRRDGERIHAAIEMPLNALYVPRICSNGKKAHVTWKYCPWTGNKLPD